MRRAVLIALALVAVWRVATLGQSALTGAQLNGAQLNGADPTDTPTLTPTITPTDTPTDTPTVTETPTDTPTLAPGTFTYTETPTPTATPLPAGCCQCAIPQPGGCANVVEGEACPVFLGCAGSNRIAAYVCGVSNLCEPPPAVTPTATLTPVTTPGCCKFDGLGVPPYTCIDNLDLSPDSITSLGGCLAIGTLIGANAIGYNAAVYCDPLNGGGIGLCDALTFTPTPTITPTPADTSTPTPTPTAVTTPGCCACDGPACVALVGGQFCPPNLNCVFDPLLDCRADACVTYTPTPTITSTVGVSTPTPTPLFACCQDTAATPSPCINVSSNDSCPGGYNKHLGLVCGGGSVCTTPTPVSGTSTPTHTPTITQTPTITPTPTQTPTFTCGPLVDNRNVPNLSLQGATCVATPCPFGTPVPAANDFGQYKVSSCDASGTASIVTYCLPHTGHWAGTPIPVGSPVACPGSQSFRDTYEQCMQRIVSGTGIVCGHIDRLPDAEVKLHK